MQTVHVAMNTMEKKYYLNAVSVVENIMIIVIFLSLFPGTYIVVAGSSVAI